MGAFYVFGFPFFTSFFDITDMWFKNRHRKAVFKRSATDIISAEEKETFFSSVTNTNQGLKDELHRARQSEALKIQALNNEIEDMFKYFQYAVFRNIGNKIALRGVEAVRLGDILRTEIHDLHTIPDPTHIIKAFVDSEIFDKLKEFSTTLSSMNYENEARKVTLNRETILNSSGINENNLDEYIDYFMAFELIKKIDRVANIYITSDKFTQEARKHSYLQLERHRSTL